MVLLLVKVKVKAKTWIYIKIKRFHSVLHCKEYQAQCFFVLEFFLLVFECFVVVGMLFCIVTFSLWLHYNKLRTYLLTYLLIQCLIWQALRPQGPPGMDHTVLPAYYTIPAFYLCKHSPEGVTTDCIGRHIIAAYYSCIDPQKMKS